MDNSLCEHKRNHVSQMHAITTRPSTRIQEERLALLIAVQYGIKVSVYPLSISALLGWYYSLRHTYGRKTSHDARECVAYVP
jgi:hypothetical protein